MHEENSYKQTGVLARAGSSEVEWICYLAASESSVAICATLPARSISQHSAHSASTRRYRSSTVISFSG